MRSAGSEKYQQNKARKEDAPGFLCGQENPEITQGMPVTLSGNRTRITQKETLYNHAVVSPACFTFKTPIVILN